jgi:RNA polymerase sigma-70 factor (ECF subfamily)
VNIQSAAEAVEALIHEYYKLVFHTIYGLTSNWEESLDLTQDTFHQALKGIDAARAASGSAFHAKAWLLRIALNTVRMQKRRRAIFHFVPFSHLAEHKQQEQVGNTETVADTIYEQAAPVQPGGYGQNNTDDPAEIVAERDMVQQTMAQLSEPFRVCLLLSIIGGLSTAEIADLLSIKEAAVRQRLARARKQFQQIYMQESGEELIDTNGSTRTTQTSSQVQQGSEDPQKRRRNSRDASYASNDRPQRLSLTTLPQTPGRSYV